MNKMFKHLQKIHDNHLTYIYHIDISIGFKNWKLVIDRNATKEVVRNSTGD